MSHNKLKLFISYSHKDDEENQCIDKFKKHTIQLQREGLIDIWHDNEIIGGEGLKDEINENLEDADIVCLFMSSNYLFSDWCMEEKSRALELKEKKGISVINIILSDCEWQKDESISDLKALPKDGKCIFTSDKHADVMWNNVCNELRRVVEKKIKINQLTITEDHEAFLKDTEMLTNAHSQKEAVILDDIFVYPDLIEYNLSKGVEKKVSSKEIIESILNYPNLVIAGEAQSGKTSLCKVLFKKLRANNFVPVYIQIKGLSKKDILKIVASSFKEQYEGVNIKEIDKKRIVPIIDDFHHVEYKERYIKDLSKNYKRFILIVDDIANINIKDEELIGLFKRFQIGEFKPSLRYKLVEKWVRLTDKETNNYQNIDQNLKLTDSTLGKTIGTGIMPSYPFFILSAIVTYNTFGINKEITSQGYCYLALVYFYLKKEGVEENDIDAYINFLTEFAYHIYKTKKSSLTPLEFKSFFKWYLENFILKIPKEEFVKNLSPIILVDTFNNYSFSHPYFYFFFVAKYLADNINDASIQEEIDNILEKLHVDENAYITVFLAHHSRDAILLDKVENIVLNLFKEYEPAKLTKDEVEFFDDQIDHLVNAVIDSKSTPEMEREKRMKREDECEELNRSKQKEIDSDNVLEKDLRRAIKTSEVIGCIIKNRYGSLNKTKLENIFNETMDLYLRILSCYFELIKNENGQNIIIDILSENIKKDIENIEEKETPNDEEIRKIAKFIFWNLSFIIVNTILSKIIHSLGSDNLSEIISKVCNEKNTPASFIVEHGVLMWYSKNLQPEEIAKRVAKKDFSDLGNRVIRFLVVNYCAVHYVDHGNLRHITKTLRIPIQELLTEHHKKSKIDT